MEIIEKRLQMNLLTKNRDLKENFYINERERERKRK